jgi:hypothetical protein
LKTEAVVEREIASALTGSRETWGLRPQTPVVEGERRRDQNIEVDTDPEFTRSCAGGDGLRKR